MSEKLLADAQPVKPEAWLEPTPLVSETSPQPYPLDALPEMLSEAVREVLDFTKAPPALVASSALAALSLSVQAHVDVERAKMLSGPVGLFLLTIADSGERKSTCDGFFTQAIRAYQLEQAEAMQKEVQEYHADQSAWEAKHAGIKEKIRHLAKSGKPTEALEATLRELEQKKPQHPKVPRLIYSDATPEALKWNLSTEWPSGGVVSSEAGDVFGSHAMNKDSIMRNLATLNQLWDGAELTTERRTSESFTVRGARLTIALQVQEATLRNFFQRSGDLARGTGFLARFLVAWPESTQGTRYFSESPGQWPALEKFNQRITRILQQPLSMDNAGALTPRMLTFTPETKAAWVAFHDQIERELCTSGELYDVRDVASKTADNAARIAALFQIFREPASQTVELDAFTSASEIAFWHLQEARRFYGELALPERYQNAIQLERWLLDYCRKNETGSAPRREAQRNTFRTGSILDAALDELEEASHIRLVQNGKRKEIHLNPTLLEL